MRRRQFVATALLAGSTAGCVGLEADDSPSGSNDTADTTNDDSTETMANENKTSVKRHIELTNVETPPEDVPVSIGVNIQESEVTPDHPARIEVGFVITDEFHLATGPDVPVGLTPSDGDTPGLVLLPLRDASEIPRVNDEMWKSDHPKDQQWTERASEYSSDVSPQTLFTSELEVWADHRYDGYFEPGEYRFSNRFAVDDERVSWSFTISVSYPE